MIFLLLLKLYADSFGWNRLIRLYKFACAFISIVYKYLFYFITRFITIKLNFTKRLILIFVVSHISRIINHIIILLFNYLYFYYMIRFIGLFVILIWPVTNGNFNISIVKSRIFLYSIERNNLLIRLNRFPCIPICSVLNFVSSPPGGTIFKLLYCRLF